MQYAAIPSQCFPIICANFSNGFDVSEIELESGTTYSTISGTVGGTDTLEADVTLTGGPITSLSYTMDGENATNVVANGASMGTITLPAE